MANQQKGEEGREPAGFPVDDCFGAGIDRPLAELINDPAVNGTELITFEEFIRSSSKRRKEQQGKGGHGTGTHMNRTDRRGQR